MNSSISALDQKLPPGSLRRRLSSGISYSVLGAVFNQGSTFAINLVVANLIGRAGFGQYAIVQSTVATLSLASAATPMTANKFVAELRSTDRVRAGRILAMLAAIALTMSGAMAIALALARNWMAVHLLHAPGLETALLLAAGTLVFNIANMFLISVLAGLEAYPRQAKALVTSGVFYFIACAAGCKYGGLNGAVAGVLVSAIFQFTLLLYHVTRECGAQQIPVSLRGSATERSVFMTFALPAAICGCTSTPALWMANVFLARSAGGYADVALYSASLSLLNVVLFIPQIANNVGLSLLNNEMGRGERSRYRRLFWTNLVFTTGLAMCGALVTIAAGPWLLAMFGKSFQQGRPMLAILMIAAIPQALSVAMSQLNVSIGRMWPQLLAVNIPRDITLPLVTFVLLPRYQAVGAAWAYLLAASLGFAGSVVLNWRDREWITARSVRSAKA